MAPFLHFPLKSKHFWLPTGNYENAGNLLKWAFWGFQDQFTKTLGRAFQSSYNKNKNCFEILMAKEMGFDREPIEFQTFYFSHLYVTPPSLDTPQK